jgi:flagella basal body P-ring formation protein FlgA
LVQRDQGVTLIYQTAGLYLTTRGKALDNGTEGDTVSVLNPQSKRTITGVVTGRGQITIEIATPKAVAAADTTASIGSDEPAASVSPVATRAQVTSKPE